MSVSLRQLLAKQKRQADVPPMMTELPLDTPLQISADHPTLAGLICRLGAKVYYQGPDYAPGHVWITYEVYPVDRVEPDDPEGAPESVVRIVETHLVHHTQLALA